MSNMKNVEYPKVGDVVAHVSMGWITEITRVAVDVTELGRRLVAFSVRGRDRDGIPTRKHIDYPAADWFDGNFAPVQVEVAPDAHTPTPLTPLPQDSARAEDGAESALYGAQPLQMDLPDVDELEAFQREANALGVPITTWLRGLGRKAVGLDP